MCTNNSQDSVSQENQTSDFNWAISGSDYDNWGCPYCGHRSVISCLSSGETFCLSCGCCGKGFVVLADGYTESKCSFRKVDGIEEPIKLQKHPREGIPKHGDPDKRPETGGEFFKSRGTGRDNTSGCFVCGGDKGPHRNIAAFVQCKESGERVEAMFKTGARLDYREHEPDYVQVKIGACDRHVDNLEKLHELVGDGIITEEKISQAIKFIKK